MRTYKLFRIKNGKLFPMFVASNQETHLGEWLTASVGEMVDETHVRSRLGPLSLRPGWHSCEIPFTDWIGKKAPDGTLLQRKNTVWCECEVDGEKITVTERHGLRTIPDGWYYFRTKPNQPFPWVISERIFIRRILSHNDVKEICAMHGVEAQKLEE